MKRIRTGMHMKYRDGYLCEYDDLWQLPVEILEDIIIRAYSGGYPFSISGDIRSLPS